MIYIIIYMQQQDDFAVKLKCIQYLTYYIFIYPIRGSTEYDDFSSTNNKIASFISVVICQWRLHHPNKGLLLLLYMISSQLRLLCEPLFFCTAHITSPHLQPHISHSYISKFNPSYLSPSQY